MKATKKKTAAKKVTKGQNARSTALKTNLKKSIEKLAAPLAAAPKVKENTLWNWFKDGVTAALSNWHGENVLRRLHMVRVENSASAGFTDVEACYNGIGFTAELKTLARPEQKDKKKAPVLTLPHFTTAQALFLAARWDAGERSWLFVQIGDTRYLVPGNKANEFLKPFKESAMQKAAVDPLCGDAAIDYLLTMVGK